MAGHDKGGKAQRPLETIPGRSELYRTTSWATVFLRAFAGFVLVLLLGVGIGSRLVVGWLRTELDAALKRVFQTRYEVSGFSLNIFPPGINLASLRVFLDDREVLSGREVRVDMAWTDERLEVVRLEIHGGQVVVIRDADGGYSFAKVLRGERFTEAGELPGAGPELGTGNGPGPGPGEPPGGSGGKAPSDGPAPGWGQGRGPGRGRVHRLPAVEIFGAVVTYEDPRLPRPLVIRDASAIVRPGDERGSYRAKISGTPAGGGRLALDGDFSLRRENSQVAFKWKLVGVAAAEVSSYFPDAVPPSTGTIEGQGSLEGPLRSPVLEGQLAVAALGLGELVTGTRVSASGFELRIRADRERINLDPSADEVRIRDEHLGKEPILLRETGGRLALSAEIEAFRQPPGWRVNAYSPAGRFGGYGYSELGLGISGSTSGALALDDLRVVLNGAKAEAHGSVDPWARASTLAFRVEDLDLAPLSAPASGTLTGHCTVIGSLGGTWEAPKLDGRFHVRALDWSRGATEIDLEHLQAAFAVQKGPAGWTGEISELKGRILGGGLLTGGGKLDPKGGARISVAGLEAKNLFSAMAVPGASARGKMDVEGKLIRWERTVPEIEMKISAPELRLFIEPAGQKILLDLGRLETEVALGPTREGAKLNFLSLEAEALGGKVTANGTIRVLPRHSYDLNFKLSRCSSKEISNLVANEAFSLLGTADIAARLQGDAGKAVLAGSAALGNSKIYVKVGGKPITLYPESLGGPIRVGLDQVELGPLEGKLAGGSLRLGYRIDLADREHPWKTSFQAEDIDVRTFVAPYLTQKHDLSGRISAGLVINGRGEDKGSVTGTGSLACTGRVDFLEVLAEAEKTYKMRNLSKIEIKKASGRLVALAGSLRLKELVIESSHGLARGEGQVELDTGEVSGKADVALEHKVLSSAHRLLAFLEGGHFFNFSTHLSGTMLAPVWQFSSRRAQVERPTAAAAVFKSGR